MHDTPQVNSAVDAVRCLYLARIAEQKGHPDAAQRWQQMASGWLKHRYPHAEQAKPETR